MSKLLTGTVGVPFVQVGKDCVECNRGCIICGSVGVVPSGSGMMVLMKDMTSLSKHFMKTTVMTFMERYF
jgi:hypothetical protein